MHACVMRWYKEAYHGSNQTAPSCTHCHHLVPPLLTTQILRPFMLRRLKESVATELPTKTEHVLRCPMAPYQVSEPMH